MLLEMRLTNILKIADIDNKTITVDESQLEVIQTLGFTELIFWLYQKRIDPGIIEIEELYIQFIDLISEFEQYPIFKPKVLHELAKVSKELEEILYGDMPRFDYFEFPQDGPNGFDYGVLADFMYTIRYDNNNKVIHVK